MWIVKKLSAMSHDLYPAHVINCHTFSNPLGAWHTLWTAPTFELCFISQFKCNGLPIHLKLNGILQFKFCCFSFVTFGHYNSWSVVDPGPQGRHRGPSPPKLWKKNFFALTIPIIDRLYDKWNSPKLHSPLWCFINWRVIKWLFNNN